MAIKSKVSQAIINLQVTMGFTRNEAIRLNYKNTSERFQKNIVPALIFLQQEMRYKSTDLDNLYGSGSRWYQGVIKKDVSRNIKINTIIKLATAFEMASFIYEDTPDQLKTTQEVKRDMEKALLTLVTPTA